MAVTVGSGEGFAGAPGYKGVDRYDDRIPRVLDLVEGLRPARLLDVGCGDGFFMALARERGAGRERIAGVEINEQAAAEARERGFECATWSAGETLPFAAESFDLVFAGEVIEHVGDPDTFFGELHRVLAPRGVLLLTTPNLLAWFNRILVPLGVTPMFVEHSYRATFGPAYSLFRRVGRPVGHLRVFNWVPLRCVLEQNGFRVRRLTGSACIPVPVVHQVDRLIARTRSTLAGNLIVVAERADVPSEP